MRQPPPAFLFATGIENSNPTIDHGRHRVDELESTHFYKLWRTDFELCEEMGIPFLRYGPPIHRTWMGPGKYDWSFADETMTDLAVRDICPIVDLCHFGLPDWLGNFQNPEWPALFGDYADAFAERYPWVQLYTPVNEIIVCSLFSARYGWWNEQGKTDRTFVTCLKNLCLANLFAMQRIVKRRIDAIFIQSEAAEHFHPATPAAMPAADRRNQERFLSLDLSYGRPVDSEMYLYLMDNGMSRQEYETLMRNDLKRHCIMGTDYYLTNEHRVTADGMAMPSGEVLGYDAIMQQYYRRYGLPVMHTETNFYEGPVGDEAVNWLHRQWAKLMQLHSIGIPVMGFTWYSLIDQVDWDCALRFPRGKVNPLGLYDIDRKIRPVGEAYKELIREWHALLPARSTALSVPVMMPSQHPDAPRGDKPPRRFY